MPGFGEAGLASATVSPSNLALRSITPSVLDGIGRRLCRFGESLHTISIRNGKVALTPACQRGQVHGSDDPTTLVVHANALSGPDTTRIDQAAGRDSVPPRSGTQLRRIDPGQGDLLYI